MVRDSITQRIKEAAKKSQLNADISISHPTNSQFGDYSTNIAMQVAKKLQKPPMEIAQQIASFISIDEIVEKVEVLKPGYINIWVSKQHLLLELKKIVEEKEQSIIKPSTYKKVVVEFSSPNIAKPFTIGHLRSTIIGNAIANILEAVGWQVYRDNHLGDWGTQFGKQIYAIKTWGNENEIQNSEQPVKLLVDLYIKFHSEAEKNPKLENEARKWFKKLEDGDEEARKIWKNCIQWSLKEFKQIYRKLNIKFTENAENSYMGYGEAFFEDKMQPVISELKDKNLLKESEGAQLIFFKDDKYPPLMILKDDGATLYSTRDLATDKFRLEHYGKDIIVLNEVGAEQSLYFQQLFEIEEMLGWYKPGQRVHIGHGMYRFKDKKMSTRKGKVIWLEEVLEEAEKRASVLGHTSNDSLEILSATTSKIAIGAIKWNDLKRSAKQDVVFDWDDILNMQGNSGPYMQYTYVRSMSVLKGQSYELRGFFDKVLQQEESDLLRTLILFEEVIIQAAELFAPHIISTYLFDLAQKFNLFYQKFPILKAEEETREFRLLLTDGTARVIKKGLGLLGIETLEKM